MRVLVVGAGGFIGSHVAAGLLNAGHAVVAAVRDPERVARRFPGVPTIRCDLARERDPAAWLPRLAGVEAVVNCAGLLRARGGAEMEGVHVLGPRALFQACAAARVRRVIHVSAVSADPEAGTAYALTKKRGEEQLAGLDLDWVVLRPSLVLGQGSYGGSSLLRGLAGLPFLIPVVGAGRQPFQPIWMGDLVETVVRLLQDHRIARQALSPVGPDRLTMAEILPMLRGWLGFRPARLLQVPLPLVRALARLGDWSGGGPLNSTALRQLEYGNVAAPEPFAAAVGFSPRSLAAALATHPSHVQDRWHARLFFLRPALRLVLALLWLASGLLGLFAASEVTAGLVTRAGLPAGLAPVLLYGSCALDLLVGMLLLAGDRARKLGVLQLAVVLAYTLGLGWAAPELWLDPLGPLLKNLPILALVLVWMAVEEQR